VTPAFGVLLTQIGSPAEPTTAAVRAYLREFLADPRVVDLPRLRWWLIRNLFVLPFRPRRSARLYRSIWTPDGSPLLVTADAISHGLGSRLRSRLGSDIPTRTGMRYGTPSIADGLDRLREAGCRRVLVLPLFPQFSHTTTSSASDAATAWSRDLPDPPEIRLVESYHDHAAYLGALETTVREFWHAHGAAERLLMSFHGLPRRYAEAGDPYPRHCATTARALAARLDLAPGRWHMAYQSRFGREEWLRPALDDRLSRWGAAGTIGVDVICPGFAVDCLETLEEVAIAGRNLFESAGGRSLRYIPALNRHPAHLDALAEIVSDHARDWLE
jgi:ferrochelatase